MSLAVEIGNTGRIVTTTVCASIKIIIRVYNWWVLLRLGGSFALLWFVIESKKKLRKTSGANELL